MNYKSFKISVFFTLAMFSYCATRLSATTYNIYTDQIQLETYGSDIINLYAQINGSIMTNTDSALHDSSTVNILDNGAFVGGSGNGLTLYDSSTLNINGNKGVSCFLSAYGSSTINLYNGGIGYDMYLADNSTLNIYGGTIDTWNGNHMLKSTATINIYGYGFEYDPHGYWFDFEGWWVSKLTGYTLEGTPVTYQGLPDPATNPNIHFIPEPATIFLLGLGAVMLRRRK